MARRQATDARAPGESNRAKRGSGRRRLRAEIGEEVYSSWFPRIELDGVSAGLVRLSGADTLPQGMDSAALSRSAWRIVA